MSQQGSTGKTPGQLAYEEDVRDQPLHHDGAPRPSWGQLAAIYGRDAQLIYETWERNPTARKCAPKCAQRTGA